jgi:hypothetical protein
MISMMLPSFARTKLVGYDVHRLQRQLLPHAHHWPLVIVTLTAAAIVIMHALRRYRQFHDTEDQGFRLSITLGNSAIATVGIVWQLFPILLVPVCA